MLVLIINLIFLKLEIADPHLLTFVPHIVSFVGFVFADSSKSEAVTRGAVGVLG